MAGIAEKNAETTGAVLAPRRLQRQPSRGMVLPEPLSDEEKYRYIRYNSWVLTLCSMASFPFLLISQLRLMMHYHWFCICAPFVALGVLFLALPLLTDSMTNSFDLRGHQRLVTG